MWNPCVFACFATCLVALTGPIARAGQFNETLSVGDTAPLWQDLPGTDGKLHSLQDLKEDAVVVVVFTCNSCPVATAYEDRIIALARAYEGKVTIVAINSNRIPEDSIEAMQQRAAAKQFPYLYLADKSQTVARDYGAVFTPEFFILTPDRKVAYLGGMDDNSDPQQVTRKDLEAALEAVLKGETPAVSETLARGCRIRYTRSRPVKPGS